MPVHGGSSVVYDDPLHHATAYVGYDAQKEGFSNYFLADGVADNEQIEDMMDYVDALGGGLGFIEEGTFRIAATMPIRGDITVQGAGPHATTLILEDDADCNMFEWDATLGTAGWFTLRDMELNGNRPNNVSGIGVRIQAGAGQNLSDNRFIDLFIRRFSEHGLHIDYAWGDYFARCVVEFNEGNGLYIGGGSAHFLNNRWLENVLDGARFGGGPFSIIGDTFEMNGGHGAIATGGLYENRFIGCEFRNNSQTTVNTSYGLSLNSTRFAVVDGCVFDGGNQEAYGIAIAVASQDCLLGDNTFRDHVTAPISDGGTRTKLPTLSGEFPLSNLGGGAVAVAPVINTSPGGIDIDADNEFAHAKVPLPMRLHQVVRIKIWAYSNVIEATNNMLLRIVAHGAGSNELWNGNAIDVVSHPSEETGGIVQYDVIHWIIDRDDDPQIWTLAAQDLVELLAVGEALSAPDIATDALFGGYEIEYV